MAETILVVDDEPDVRAVDRDALVSLGYVARCRCDHALDEGYGAG
jgi:CheY-like chemotaxis protein